MICKKKRISFNILREVKELSEIYRDLPEDDECFKLVSNGQFSSLAFIKFVCERSNINYMFAATLRVGRKHLWVLDELHRNGKIKNVQFVVGSVMKNDSDTGKTYKYYDNLDAVCKNNGWNVAVANNHAKVILMDTDVGKFVLETSSNLNENPNMEQFSFEKNNELYEQYLSAFGEMVEFEKR